VEGERETGGDKKNEAGAATKAKMDLFFSLRKKKPISAESERRPRKRSARKKKRRDDAMRRGKRGKGVGNNEQRCGEKLMSNRWKNTGGQKSCHNGKEKIGIARRATSIARPKNGDRPEGGARGKGNVVAVLPAHNPGRVEKE